MARFINLTPHPLHIIKADGSAMDLPASGDVARVGVKTVEVAVVDGIAITAPEYGSVEGLPEPEEGTILLVSRMVKDRVPSRQDVMVPGNPIRDSEGKIVGSNGLSL